MRPGGDISRQPGRHQSGRERIWILKVGRQKQKSDGFSGRLQVEEDIRADDRKLSQTVHPSGEPEKNRLIQNLLCQNTEAYSQKSFEILNHD